MMVTESTKVVYEPWRVRSADLPILWKLYWPTRLCPSVRAVSGSEEAMHYASWKNRELETMPPLVTRYPVGMWANDGYGSLYQLRHIPVEQLVTQEQPYESLVAKYARWMDEGHQPPPIRGTELRGGRIKISDGHHRLAAQIAQGKQSVRVWVSVIDPKGNHDLTHEVAVLNALYQRARVPLSVWSEYGSTRKAALAVLPTLRTPLMGY